MSQLGRLPYLRRCEASDDAFLYDVFSTTWASEVAALPNQKLARHVLRIQHIAQERRLASRYPGHERFIVVEDGQSAGRLYVHDQGPSLNVIDLTLMPQFRSRGIGTRLFRDLFEEAGQDGRTVTLRVGRTNHRATDLYTALGFQLVAVDDLDNSFEWNPNAAEETSAEGSDTQAAPLTGATKESAEALHPGAERR